MMTTGKTLNNKALLLILDGMGISNRSEGNATTEEFMPFTHQLMTEYGYAKLHNRQRFAASNRISVDVDVLAGHLIGRTLDDVDSAFKLFDPVQETTHHDFSVEGRPMLRDHPLHV